MSLFLFDFACLLFFLAKVVRKMAPSLSNDPVSELMRALPAAVVTNDRPNEVAPAPIRHKAIFAATPAEEQLKALRARLEVLSQAQ